MAVGGTLTASTITSASATALTIKSAGTTAMTIDTSQNVGIGTTPSAWAASRRALQVGGSSTVATLGLSSGIGEVLYNTYFDGTNFKYINTNYAASFDYNNAASGGFAWRTAASGTAGNNVTLTQAMTLDSSGNLGIGTSSPGSKLSVTSGNNEGIVTTNGTQTTKLFNSTSITAGALWVTSNHALSLGTNNAEQMRIKSDGTIWCGGSSFPAGTTGQINCLNTAGTPFAGYVNTTGGYAQIYFNNPNGAVGQIYTTGSTTTYATSSDYRLKHNVQSMSSGLSVIFALKPVTYKWNADNSDGEGFIAHELQSVIPHAVTGEKDAVNDDGSIKPQGVDYGKIVVHLVAAIQELSTKNDALEARLAALEAK